jgi:hypothetical protein
MKSLKMHFLTVVLLLSLGLALTGCENEDIQSWRTETKGLREEAERELSHVPYRRPQHTAFKSYFTSLATMALSLEQDAGRRQRFSDAASRAGLGSICQDLFMSEARWRQLLESCTKNRFFLCAEEVRAYPSFIRVLRDGLRPELQRRFNEASQCRIPSAIGAQSR